MKGKIDEEKKRKKTKKKKMMIRRSYIITVQYSIITVVDYPLLSICQANTSNDPPVRARGGCVAARRRQMRGGSIRMEKALLLTPVQTFLASSSHLVVILSLPSIPSSRP